MSQFDICMKSCYHCALLHCPTTPFIVFLMLYKYNSLKKKKSFTSKWNIFKLSGMYYIIHIVICRWKFQYRTVSWCFCWFACRLFHSYSCCFNISSDDHLSTNQRFAYFPDVWISIYLKYTPICIFVMFFISWFQERYFRLHFTYCKILHNFRTKW